MTRWKHKTAIVMFACWLGVCPMWAGADRAASRVAYDRAVRDAAAHLREGQFEEAVSSAQRAYDLGHALFQTHSKELSHQGQTGNRKQLLNFASLDQAPPFSIYPFSRP